MFPRMNAEYASASSAVRLSPRSAHSFESTTLHFAALLSRCSRWKRGRGSCAVFSRLTCIAYAHARSQQNRGSIRCFGSRTIRSSSGCGLYRPLPCVSLSERRSRRSRRLQYWRYRR